MSKSRYPATERETAGGLSVGDQILIRDRRTDQPMSIDVDDVRPFVPGAWIVLHNVPGWSDGGRRRSRYYSLTVEHPSGEVRTFKTSSVQRFNRIVG